MSFEILSPRPDSFQNLIAISLYYLQFCSYEPPLVIATLYHRISRPSLKKNYIHKQYQEWGSNPRGQHVHWILSPTP